MSRYLRGLGFAVVVESSIVLLAALSFRLSIGAEVLNLLTALAAAAVPVAVYFVLWERFATRQALPAATRSPR